MAVSPSLKEPFVALAIRPSTPTNNSIPPVQLSWRALALTTKTKNRKNKQVDTKAILDHVTGDALPRQLLAVVGPNGSGKTSLLKCLIGQSTVTSGTVVVSTRDSDTSASAKTVTYIPQGDLLQPALTIQDHLFIQARLRLPTKPTQLEITNHIERVLAQVNLTEQAHTQIGQLPSNADRKLVAIATELLTAPSVLILDEPTHGLDSVNADRVVNTLHQLARNGHTVIASFNETTSSVFRLADKLHLLAEGRTVYRGTPSGMVSHFESHGVTIPAFTNPLELYKQFVTPRGHDQSSVERLIGGWTADPAVPAPDDAVVGDVSRAPVTFEKSVFAQLSILTAQNCRRISRDKAALIQRSVLMIVIALLLGLIFSQLSISQKYMQPFSSATFFFAAAQFIPTAILELRTAPPEVRIAMNDHANGRAHVLSWYFVKNVTELPLQLFFPMVFLIPAYFIVGYTSDTEIFFSFYWFLVLVVMAGTAVGYFAACAAPKPGIEMAIGIPIIAFSVLLGGAFVNRLTTPSYLVWLQQILPIKYAYHGMMRAFWSKVDSIYCPPGANCRATTGLGVLTVNVIKPDHFKSDSLILFAIIMALRVAGALVLWLRARK